MMACLIRAGSDVNAADNDGNTVLHCMCQGVQLETCAMLVEEGAMLTARNVSMASPVDLWTPTRKQHRIHDYLVARFKYRQSMVGGAGGSSSSSSSSSDASKE
mmetsp:Transcript_2481/g.3850  ORF Transcript_2481/g.3850 Transcript_2481/m.3850 type:complete len:103 (+) Transcript_2481:719-1027(+)